MEDNKGVEVGTFNVSLEIGDFAGSQFVQVEALVDTGVTYTTLPADILTGIGVAQEGYRRFELADNRIVEYPIGHARMRLEGQEVIVLVVFVPEETVPRVGATALEICGLGVDRVNRRLAPVVALMKSPMLAL